MTVWRDEARGGPPGRPRPGARCWVGKASTGCDRQQRRANTSSASSRWMDPVGGPVCSAAAALVGDALL